MNFSNIYAYHIVILSNIPFFQTVLAIASSRGGKGAKEDGQEISEWVEKQILEVYKNSDKLPLIKATLKKLIVT